MVTRDEIWPALPMREWEATCLTLHRWTQIVGKIRMTQTPLINHWWNVPLYVSSRGLTTSPVPYGAMSFEIEFDFVAHQLCVTTSFGDLRAFALRSEPVAEFHRKLIALLRELGIEVPISDMPVEVPSPVAFTEDLANCTYDGEYANRFWRILVQTSRIFTDFRARFIGKVSPVHFFWGSFDLAVTRFSGRVAPPHGPVPNIPLAVVREAYSHEVSSAGFWPGGYGVDTPIFYSYAYPEPPGFSARSVRPAAAKWDQNLGEFVLSYDDVRNADSPEEMLLEFLQSTYEAAAECAQWDRAALEASGR
jgi:hypothetical protein